MYTTDESIDLSSNKNANKLLQMEGILKSLHERVQYLKNCLVEGNQTSLVKSMYDDEINIDHTDEIDEPGKNNTNQTISETPHDKRSVKL